MCVGVHHHLHHVQEGLGLIPVPCVCRSYYHQYMHGGDKISCCICRTEQNRKIYGFQSWCT